LGRLDSSKALEPLSVSIVDQVTNREYRHPTTGETNNKQSAGIKLNRIHPASNAAVASFNTNYATSTLNSGITSVSTSGTTQFIRPSFPIRPSVKKMSF
jgi:hypothetical protein